jgi:hypothetical protein
MAAWLLAMSVVFQKLNSLIEELGESQVHFKFISTE